MHFKKITSMFMIVLFIGCAKDNLSTSEKIVLKQEQFCIDSSKKIIINLMKPNRVFLSNNLFKNGSTLIISTQKNVEVPIKQHQINRKFILKKDKNKCYIEEIELFRVINREEISCQCIK